MVKEEDRSLDTVDDIFKRRKPSKKGQDERPFYYLHGAFHLYFREENNITKYWKISTDTSSNECMEKLKDSIEKIINHLVESKNKISTLEKINRPLLIFEDRSDVKRTLIEKDAYLKMCYEELEKTSGHVFVFGCSFERDAHILEALFHPPHKDLYIAYLEGDNHTKDNVKAFLKQKSPEQSSCVSIFWVKVELSEKHLLWTHHKTF